MQPFDAVDRLEDASALDRLVKPVRRTARRVLPRGPIRDALHGVWLGHPLHPVLVQGTLGALMSASVLDALPHTPARERTARTLVAVGLVSAPPTATAGWADWSQLHEQQQRVGLVHAASNLTGLALYGASLAVRAGGRRGVGKALGFAGLGVLSFGGFLGGHLSYRQAVGANHAEDVPHLVEPGWHDLCAVDDLPPDGQPQQRMLGDVPLAVIRHGPTVDVISDRCSHLSGPLHQGRVSDDPAEGRCVKCPWHGSTFRLSDGGVVRGPATSPQPVFDVRVQDGRVQVQLPGAG